jgi:hypothetical protein
MEAFAVRGKPIPKMGKNFRNIRKALQRKRLAD